MSQGLFTKYLTIVRAANVRNLLFNSKFIQKNSSNIGLWMTLTSLELQPRSRHTKEVTDEVPEFMYFSFDKYDIHKVVKNGHWQL